MPPKSSRQLVIDASVARASGGEEATYPTSKNCRDFLTAVLRICHHLVLSPDMADEWDRNQSGFARRWRASMVARKKVHRVGHGANAELRQKVERITPTDKDREAVQKDFHLVEAAMATDQAIVSLDEEVRDLFEAAAKSVGELRGMAWTNPDHADEQPIQWLENGAKPEKQRRLGFQAQEKT